MSILIKGMGMPTRCGDCPCAYSTEGAYWDTCQAVDDQNDIEQFWKSGRPEWCPLVEIPPHGRLIDADALTGKAYMDGKLMCVEMDEIEEAPTIIEAEKSDGRDKENGWT